MQPPPPEYRRVDPLICESGRLETWHSPAPADPHWDNFLRRTPLGQYQQSSLWGEFKTGEGWRQHRTVVTGAEGIVGGFQILWRRKGPLRIGYVSKGPVALPQVPALYPELIRQLARDTRALGLNALIVQPPDEAGDEAGDGDGPQGFIRSNPMNVIESTYLVDVTEGMEAVRRRMHRNVRQCVRKSREQGVVVRAGTEADLPLFFDLMTATCRRQNSMPNPATLDSLRRLWRLFAASGSIELAFAGRDGRDIAGRMNLVFGDRVTQWKKGWDGTNSGWHPNELLADHALEWAQAHGHRLCDFSAISRVTALRILAGLPTDAAVARSRDMFNLRLGGQPKLVPRARIFLPNPILRWGYRLGYAQWEKRRERHMLAARV